MFERRKFEVIDSGRGKQVIKGRTRTSRKCGSSVGSRDAQKLDVTVMTAPTTNADGMMSNLIRPLDRLPTACDAFTLSVCYSRGFERAR